MSARNLNKIFGYKWNKKLLLYVHCTMYMHNQFMFWLNDDLTSYIM